MKLMGLDVGTKGIGIAVSDEMGIVAQALTMMACSGDVEKDAAGVAKLVEELKIERIVVGMPLMLDGRKGIQAEKVERFVKALRVAVKVPVVFWDERLTSAQVERLLIESGERRDVRKKVIDKLAAVVILRSYMDSLSFVSREGCSGDG